MYSLQECYEFQDYLHSEISIETKYTLHSLKIVNAYLNELNLNIYIISQDGLHFEYLNFKNIKRPILNSCYMENLLKVDILGIIEKNCEGIENDYEKGVEILNKKYTIEEEHAEYEEYADGGETQSNDGGETQSNDGGETQSNDGGETQSNDGGEDANEEDNNERNSKDTNSSGEESDEDENMDKDESEDAENEEAKEDSEETEEGINKECKLKNKKFQKLVIPFERLKAVKKNVTKAIGNFGKPSISFLSTDHKKITKNQTSVNESCTNLGIDSINSEKFKPAFEDLGTEKLQTEHGKNMEDQIEEKQEYYRKLKEECEKVFKSHKIPDLVEIIPDINIPSRSGLHFGNGLSKDLSIIRDFVKQIEINRALQKERFEQMQSSNDIDSKHYTSNRNKNCLNEIKTCLDPIDEKNYALKYKHTDESELYEVASEVAIKENKHKLNENQIDVAHKEHHKKYESCALRGHFNTNFGNLNVTKYSIKTHLTNSQEMQKEETATLTSNLSESVSNVPLIPGRRVHDYWCAINKAQKDFETAVRKRKTDQASLATDGKEFEAKEPVSNQEVDDRMEKAFDKAQEAFKVAKKAFDDLKVAFDASKKAFDEAKEAFDEANITRVFLDLPHPILPMLYQRKEL